MIKSFRKSKRLSGPSLNKKPSIRLEQNSIAGFGADPSLQLPRRVIKAKFDYDAQGPEELSFKKGDFFHLFSSEEETLAAEDAGWYEATNPMSDLKGVVPASYFDVLGPSRPIITNAVHLSSSIPVSESSNRPNSFERSRSSTGAGQLLYAVALFEFKAERADELDIVPGENLTICAHHQFEWFIAKPIDRLGGPGLIPLAYVKIVDLLKPNDPQHNVDLLQNLEPDAVRNLIEYLHIPTVEDWKNKTAKYQALTIPLNKITTPTHQAPMLPHAQFFEGSSNRGSGHAAYSPTNLMYPGGSLLSSNTYIQEACVDSYQRSQNRCQYVVLVRLSNGHTRTLFRFYQDFYDLQVKLLDVFPYEAGKIDNSQRTIPAIPGPLINVTDNVCKLRREKLDIYLRNLIALPPKISRSEPVLALFELLDNGYDREQVSSTHNGESMSPNHHQRTLKPISQKSNSQQDRMSQYSNLRNSQGNNPYDQGGINGSRTNSFTHVSQGSGGIGALGNTLPDQAQAPKFKVKFYYMDDIFVLLLPLNLRLEDLKSRLYKRLGPGEGPVTDPPLEGPEGIRLFLKNDYDEFVEENDIHNDADFNTHLREMLKEFEVDDDKKFQTVLMEKVRLVILT